MKFVQNYLSTYVDGEAIGGFNSRLYGDSQSKTMHGIPHGERWRQRNAGWELADGMIRRGTIYSHTEIDGKWIEFKCYQDGNVWCCVGPGFENLQESEAFFADTREEAIVAFAVESNSKTGDSNE